MRQRTAATRNIDVRVKPSASLRSQNSREWVACARIMMRAVTPARAPSPRVRFCPQLEALNLARRRLRQLDAKLDPAWIFVGRKRGLDVILQRAGEVVTGVL